MKTLISKSNLRDLLHTAREEKKTIGLVPTMGNLHAGHIELVRQAVQETDIVVSTIFVNPLQFGDNEDLDSYPRTLDEDKDKLETAGCDCLFVPSGEELYGNKPEKQTLIHVPELSDNYCGQSRPAHFDGVATVVSKLLNLVNPTKAFFGLKDYQQFLIIKKLVNDLDMDIEIVGVNTKRETSGLALSSRNNYLNDEQKDVAPALYANLQEVANQILAGKRSYRDLELNARKTLQEAGFTPDYFAICNDQTLTPADPSDESLVILAAAQLGSTRLIDNIRIHLTL